jgi:hypothetical protein
MVHKQAQTMKKLLELKGNENIKQQKQMNIWFKSYSLVMIKQCNTRVWNHYNFPLKKVLMNFHTDYDNPGEIKKKKKQ